MNKNEELLKARQEFIKQEVNKSNNAVEKIKELSNRLFLSTSTIEKDLRK